MVGPLIFLASAFAQDCHYQTWSWSVREKRPMEIRQVVTSKAALTADERGTVPGCSVCDEDQTEIVLNGVKFKICRRFASEVQTALQEILSQGFPIKELEGYRVGRTKGPIDARGLRTQFSHHSFGTALDINSSLNGLYDNCLSFNQQCRLIRGGPWRPGTTGTITPAGHVVKSLEKAGFKWGGTLAGKQKDFMHFSPNGD